MSVKLCFHFEDKDVEAYSGSRIDLENWRLLAKSVGIIDIDMIDLSSARWRMEDASVTLTAHDSLADFETARGADNRLVYVENVDALIAGGVTFTPFSSHGFNPTVDTYYIFGPAQGFTLAEGKEYVSLPVRDVAHAVLAAAIFGGLVLAGLG